MGKIIDALTAADCLKIREADLDLGRRMADVVVRSPGKRLYSKVQLDVEGYEEFIAACQEAGLPIVIRDNIAYYQTTSEQALIEYLKNPW